MRIVPVPVPGDGSLGSTLGLVGGESKISTSRQETVITRGIEEGREKVEENTVVESRVGWRQVCRSHLVKYPSGARVNPILEEMDPFVHRLQQNGESTRFGSKRCGDGYVVGSKSRAKAANGRISAGLAEV